MLQLLEDGNTIVCAVCGKVVKPLPDIPLPKLHDFKCHSCSLWALGIFVRSMRKLRKPLKAANPLTVI
jgi:hypothetical protein